MNAKPPSRLLNRKTLLIGGQLLGLGLALAARRYRTRTARKRAEAEETDIPAAETDPTPVFVDSEPVAPADPPSPLVEVGAAPKRRARKADDAPKPASARKSAKAGGAAPKKPSKPRSKKSGA